MKLHAYLEAECQTPTVGAKYHKFADNLIITSILG